MTDINGEKAGRKRILGNRRSGRREIKIGLFRSAFGMTAPQCVTFELGSTWKKAAMT
jgi:hypothetical protein